MKIKTLTLDKIETEFEILATENQRQIVGGEWVYAPDGSIFWISNLLNGYTSTGTDFVPDTSSNYGGSMTVTRSDYSSVTKNYDADPMESYNKKITFLGWVGSNNYGGGYGDEWGSGYGYLGDDSEHYLGRYALYQDYTGELIVFANYGADPIIENETISTEYSVVDGDYYITYSMKAGFYEDRLTGGYQGGTYTNLEVMSVVYTGYETLSAEIIAANELAKKQALEQQQASINESWQSGAEALAKSDYSYKFAQAWNDYCQNPVGVFKSPLRQEWEKLFPNSQTSVKPDYQANVEFLVATAMATASGDADKTAAGNLILKLWNDCGYNIDKFIRLYEGNTYIYNPSTHTYTPQYSTL